MVALSLLATNRRRFLGSAAAVSTFVYLNAADGDSISGALPWTPSSADPPTPVTPGGWTFFRPAEAAVMEAIVDRLVPTDDLSIGGRDAGCAMFIDRQLSSTYGTSGRLYMKAPFVAALATQGQQENVTPAGQYRTGLAAIDKYLKANGGKGFAELAPNEQDRFLSDLEAKRIALPEGVDGADLFDLMLKNTMEGFFADPLYGGNKDMASWKMLGFPGARYDYRDHVSRHNEPYTHPPVSILGRAGWSEDKE